MESGGVLTEREGKRVVLLLQIVEGEGGGRRGGHVWPLELGRALCQADKIK